MKKTTKLLLISLIPIIIFNGILLFFIIASKGVENAGLALAPVVMQLIIFYTISVACISAWGYKQIRSIVVVNGLIFILNIISGFICYHKIPAAILISSVVILVVTLITTLLVKLGLFLKSRKDNKSNKIS